MISIDKLPDDVLLAIFDFCLEHDSGTDDPYSPGMAWVSLAHVCRRWRSVVFGSPCRLDLQLVCMEKTPARDTLDIWPPLPLQIWNRGRLFENMDNIIAVLERGDRLYKIFLTSITRSHLETVVAAMQKPFPDLTVVILCLYDETVPPALPDSFLGGSAPPLRNLWLDGIPFPGLPKLLLSATRLRYLCLQDIPHSGYFSPNEMVTALSTLTSLESLQLEFQSPRSRPDHSSRRPPPPTRSVLSSLIELCFKGVCEYLDDIVAPIDAPQLDKMDITFFNDIVFDTFQFTQFISRTPTLKPLKKARLYFDATAVSLISEISDSRPWRRKGLRMKVLCRELDWQVSSLEQVCTSSSPQLSVLEDLYIFNVPSYPQPDWKDNIENAVWLGMLQLFSTVKNIYISEKFALRIVPALQELIGGGVTEVLPALQNMFLEEPQPSGRIQEGIHQFVAMRQATGHPVAVSRWDRDQGGTLVGTLVY